MFLDLWTGGEREEKARDSLVNDAKEHAMQGCAAFLVMSVLYVFWRL